MRKKLLDFQREVKAITKDATNPFFKSKYFDINGLIGEIKPILNKLGLVIVQPIIVKEGKNILKTIVLDATIVPEAGVNEEQIISEIVIPESPDIQKYGAIITYLRRYALQSLLLLEAEDDDGNSTIKQPVKTIPTYRPAVPPPPQGRLEPQPKPVYVTTAPGIANKPSTTPAAQLMKKGFEEVKEEQINVEDIPF